MLLRLAGILDPPGGKYVATVQTDPHSWQRAADPPELKAGDVYVWRTWLDVPSAQVDALGRILTTDELARAGRFVFERDQRRFVAARAALRSILGWCTGTDPRRVEFSYTASGKPELADDLAGLQLRFNLSHSHDLALVALTRERAIGVDVEYLSRDLDHERLAERFLSAQEWRSIASLDSPLRRRAFFDCWTRKEAFLKASGKGLARSLADFDVSCAPGEEARLLGVRNDPEGASRWSLRAIEPAPGYTGAVAVEGELYRLTCSEW